jgi:MFS family permease
VTFLQRLAIVGRLPRLRGLIIATLTFQTAYTLSMTLLPLQLYTVAGSEDAARSVGIVLASAAAGGALGAALMGVVSGRVGAARLTVVAFIASGVLLVSLVPLTTTLQYAIVRFAADFCGGAVLPSLRTLLAEEAARHESTASSMGAVYGLSQSAHAGGTAAGAALSAAIAAIWGIPATFAVAGLLAISTGVGWRWLVDSGRSTRREVSHGV